MPRLHTVVSEPRLSSVIQLVPCAIYPRAPGVSPRRAAQENVSCLSSEPIYRVYTSTPFLVFRSYLDTIGLFSAKQSARDMPLALRCAENQFGLTVEAVGVYCARASARCSEPIARSRGPTWSENGCKVGGTFHH